ncbi:MAG: hypothetical protein MJ151_00745, partial [Lachnospiraceae bacterium]|nr:hypothetical protein [Lachnospiraceae bacterium]
YFDDEWENPSITDVEKEAFIAQYKGQRFWTTPIVNGAEEIDNPNIAEFDVGITDIYDITYPEFTTWMAENGWNNDSIKDESSRSAIYATMETDFADRRKDFIAVLFQVDFDGDPATSNDTEIYASIYNDTDLSDLGTIRLTENNVSDTLPKIATDNIDLCGFWLQNGVMIKMQSLSDIIIEETGFEKTESGSVSIISADNMVDYTKISDFYPFVDNDKNKYIVWQQNTDMTLTEENINEPIKDSKDLFITGFVKTPAHGEEPENYSWSKPVRLTKNGKLNNLPVAVQLDNGELLFVTNQYDITENGDLYNVTNSNLQEILYKQKSSMRIKSIEACKAMEQTIENVTKYDVTITLEDDGLYPAIGYDYTGRILYNGTLWKPFEGTSDDYVEPGGIDFVNTEVYMDIDKTYRLDLAVAEINVKEKELSDSGCDSSMNVFKTEESFEIPTITDKETFQKNDGTLIEKETVMQEKNVLKVMQDGDNCIIEGVLVNNGDIDAKGDEKLYVYINGEYDAPLVSSDFIHLKMEDSTKFSFVIPYDKIDLTYGYKDLVLVVKNASGKTLSTPEVVTISPSIAYGFKVNNGVETITLKEGERLALTTTFEPSYKYRSGNILYSTVDKNVATVVDGELIAGTKGETELTLTTKEFGGSKTIRVVVSDDRHDTDAHSGSSGGGGSSGGSPRYDAQGNVLSPSGIQNNTYDGTNPPDLTGNINVSQWNVSVEGVAQNPISYSLNTDSFVRADHTPVVTDWVGVSTNANGQVMWYRTDETGKIMRDKFVLLGTSVYYFDANGIMLTGEHTINGITCYFDTTVGGTEGKLLYHKTSD